MNHRFFTAACLLSVASLFFGGTLCAQTPFELVQRQDVREEISVNDSQVQLVNRLQPFCDALCERKTREAFANMDVDLQQQFNALDSAQRQRAIEFFGQQMQETVELETLENQVLFQPQMNRFLQLWVQQAGLDALTKGAISQQLGMSNIQISQIQQIQGIGQTAMDVCRQNSQLTAQQQFTQIQNIQINMVNQCINVLSPEQAEQYVEMCGEPFEPNPSTNGDSDVNSVTPVSTETDANNDGPTVSRFDTLAPRRHSPTTGDGRSARGAQANPAPNQNSGSTRRDSSDR